MVNRVYFSGTNYLLFFLGNAQGVAYLCAMTLYAEQLRPRSSLDRLYSYPNSISRQRSQAANLAAAIISRQPYRFHYDETVDDLIDCVYRHAVQKALAHHLPSLSPTQDLFPQPDKDRFHYKKCCHLSEEVDTLAKEYIDRNEAIKGGINSIARNENT